MFSICFSGHSESSGRGVTAGPHQLLSQLHGAHQTTQETVTSTHTVNTVITIQQTTFNNLNPLSEGRSLSFVTA